jgi:hypothetical protein
VTHKVFEVDFEDHTGPHIPGLLFKLKRLELLVIIISPLGLDNLSPILSTRNVSTFHFVYLAENQLFLSPQIRVNKKKSDKRSGSVYLMYFI